MLVIVINILKLMGMSVRNDRNREGGGVAFYFRDFHDTNRNGLVRNSIEAMC